MTAHAPFPLRRAALVLGLVLRCLLIGAPASAAPQAVLKSVIVVDGEKVTLGDLFDDSAFLDAPDAAHVAVLSAPRAGEALNLDALALQRFASTHHVDWPNTERLESIKITRASTVIGPEAISASLLDALQARGLPGHLRLRFSGAMPTLYVATATAPSLSVERLDVDPTTGQFTAELRAPAGDPTGAKAMFTGRAYSVSELPVLAHDVKPGDRITEHDIVLTEMPTDKLGQNVITAARDVVGMAPKRMLRAGDPLRLGDVEPPIAVKKNTLVTMSVRAPGMTLTAEGRALEDGALGESIKVMNTNSKRTVVATVEGEGLVTVTSTGVAPTLAANQ